MKEKEIMLNKSFVGSWGIANDENIPHEIINLFKSDNGNIYIYVPPYGGFKTDEHPNIESILLTGSWNNNTTEVFYVIKGLTPLHNGGRKASRSERERLIEYIINNNIKYGGKYLHEIKMAEFEEEEIFYMTFQAEAIYKPKKPLFLSWKNNNDESKDKDICELKNKNYKYQRQIGYITHDDCELVSKIINEYDKFEKVEPVSLKDIDEITQKNPHHNFLQLIHKEYDETIFTNLIYEFFRTTPELFSKFATETLGIVSEKNYIISKEVTTTNGKGRIDLLVENDDYVIVIENKINSGLNGIDKHNHLSQLTTYIEYVETELLNGRKGAYFLFEPNYNNIDISKFDQSRGKEFTKIQYSQLYNFFDTHRSDLNNSQYAIYADDFINALYLHTLIMKDIVTQRFIDAIQK